MTDYRNLLDMQSDADVVLTFHRDRLAKLGVPAKHFYNSLRRSLLREGRYGDDMEKASIKEVMKRYRERHKKLPTTEAYYWQTSLKSLLRVEHDFAGTDANSLPRRTNRAVDAAADMVTKVLEGLHGARRDLRKRPKFNPVEAYRRKVEEEAERAVNATLSAWKPTIGVVLPNDKKPDNKRFARSFGITISIGWLRQTQEIGTSIGSRFIAQADLVDQIGEYDLYQIEYYEGSDKKRKHGFVGLYRGTKVRGFGTKPETALQWTRRQVLVAAQRKMGVI